MNRQEELRYSTRFPRIVGRRSEIQRLADYLKDWGNNHFIYYWANGGYGKTRILQELQKMVEELGPGYYSGGIIDLYHTATHASSDVEKLIIENLLRDLDPNREKYFTNYLRERALYEQIRERGADPGELEKKRASLSDFFISDFHALALQVRKLVICFDTLEIIQYESTAIEEMIGMDEVDPRIRGWMLEKLPKLANVLIVFAGRPKEGPFQERLTTDMRESFGESLDIIPLPPLNQDETIAFFQALPDGAGVCPPEYHELIYKLTGGRPILLHLVYDLLRVLAAEPRVVYEIFDQYRGLIQANQTLSVEELEQLQEIRQARKHIEHQIISDLIGSGEVGGYLELLVLLQKGFDAEIIQQVLGLSEADAKELLGQLRRLSFIKQYIPEASPRTEPGGESNFSLQIQQERLFFHDEMYRLMTDPEVIPHIRRNERQAAQGIITRFYDPHIADLEASLRESAGPADQRQRIRSREELYKLLSERLYYLLVRDPVAGYLEYKHLTARANAERATGFAMRIRDEFLRFYNLDERRNQFADKGVSHELVVRESTQLWMERFHWNGNYDKAIQFGDHVLGDPAAFFIRPEDVGVLGNVCALWARAYAMKKGFNPDVLHKTQKVLASMPSLDACTPGELLARGRLATSVGYLARWGGFFDLATEANSAALASFRKLGTHLEEQAIVLNNMAYVYAKRGLVQLARIFGEEAADLNRKIGSRYSLGLSYTNLAAVERIARTNFSRAVDYARMALDLFSEIEDFHGLVRSYLNLGSAYRHIAEEEIWRQSPSLAIKQLESAEETLKEGLTAAVNGELASEIPGIKAELGKVYRAIGRAYRQINENDKSLEFLNEAEKFFKEALAWENWSRMERADIEEDMAEATLDSGDRNKARAQLDQVRIILSLRDDGPDGPEEPVPNWYYLPMGKLERLTGHILMAENALDEGLDHFVGAYAYFQHFSPNSVEKTQMLAQLFRRYLSERPFGEVQRLVERLEKRLLDQNCKVHDVDVMPFINDLKELIGMR